MRIGVKYCGGCNPRFDRILEVKKVMERYPQEEFELLNVKKQYDRVLLVCGCERTCLRFRQDLPQEKSIVIGDIQECRNLTL